MKLIKKINNNFALAEDSKGEIIIVNGKGIGFLKMPCEATDLDIISRTYYSTDSRVYELIKKLPEEVMAVSETIYDIARKRLGQALNSNLIFTLADHIHFAIVRTDRGIRFGAGVVYEVRYCRLKKLRLSRCIWQKGRTMSNRRILIRKQKMTK